MKEGNNKYLYNITDWVDNLYGRPKRSYITDDVFIERNPTASGGFRIRSKNEEKNRIVGRIGYGCTFMSDKKILSAIDYGNAKYIYIFGYEVREDFRGQGIMPKALSIAERKIKEAVNKRDGEDAEILFLIACGNKSSERVAEKCGYTRVDFKDIYMNKFPIFYKVM